MRLIRKGREERGREGREERGRASWCVLGRVTRARGGKGSGGKGSVVHTFVQSRLLAFIFLRQLNLPVAVYVRISILE